MTRAGRRPQRGAGFLWRFSLGEILVAVAIDAVLVATVLDCIQIQNGQPTSYVYYSVVALTFGVFPFLVAPIYGLTYAFHVRRFRRWHTPTNTVLMALDVQIALLALFYIFENDSNRTRHLQLIAYFVAIAYTMFLVYAMLVQYLKRGRQSPDAAPAPAITPASPDPALRLPQPDSTSSKTR